MRLIHTADWHLGKHIEGHSRLEEQELFLEDFVNIVKERDADVVLIAGDIYDSSNPPAKAEQLFYDTLKKISDGGRRLTIVIAGNHDNPERLVSSTPLAMEHGIIMVGTPKTVIPKGQYGSWEVCRSGEGYIKIERKSEQAVVLTVPFPSEKRLEEVLYSEMESEEIQLETYNERLRCLFDRLADQFEEETVNIIVSHLFVMDSLEEGSERSIQLGGSYLADPDIFPKLADYVALGHIHRPQSVPGHPNIRYSGSPIEYRKGEERYQKQVLCVDIRKGEPVKVEPIELKQYKPIEVWRCTSISEAIMVCEENRDKNCWVYLEIETERAILEDEIKKMKQTKKDILEIHPILREKDTEEAETSWKDRPFPEVFAEFYRRERGVEMSEETRDMLLKLCEEEEPHETD